MTLKELLYSKIEEDMVILPQEERLVCMDLKQFAEQPIAGILYDLGALPEDCLNRLDEGGKKPTELNVALLNLYAAGQVISFLGKKLEQKRPQAAMHRASRKKNRH